MSPSGVLHQFFFAYEVSFRSELLIISGQHRKDASTNFFVLSNIRFVSGGSSEMLRTSRWFRVKLLQSDGPRTLAVTAPSLYSLSSPFEKKLVAQGRSSCLTAGKSESFLKRYTVRDQSTFELGPVGVEGPVT